MNKRDARVFLDALALWLERRADFAEGDVEFWAYKTNAENCRKVMELLGERRGWTSGL